MELGAYMHTHFTPMCMSHIQGALHRSTLHIIFIFQITLHISQSIMKLRSSRASAGGRSALRDIGSGSRKADPGTKNVHTCSSTEPYGQDTHKRSRRRHHHHHHRHSHNKNRNSGRIARRTLEATNNIADLAIARARAATARLVNEYYEMFDMEIKYREEKLDTLVLSAERRINDSVKRWSEGLMGARKKLIDNATQVDFDGSPSGSMKIARVAIESYCNQGEASIPGIPQIALSQNLISTFIPGTFSPGGSDFINMSVGQALVFCGRLIEHVKFVIADLQLEFAAEGTEAAGPREGMQVALPIYTLTSDLKSKSSHLHSRP